MDFLLSRLPNPKAIAARALRHRAKIAGFFAGSVGTLVLTTFLTVAITGIPYGGERLDPDRSTVYPNF